jgi:nuclear control of ATPase protein 2
MGSESLNSDIESLERMVVSFAKDHGLPPSELDLIAEASRKGDLTVILQNYEDEIKSPFKNAMRGKI